MTPPSNIITRSKKPSTIHSPRRNLSGLSPANVSPPISISALSNSIARSVASIHHRLCSMLHSKICILLAPAPKFWCACAMNTVTIRPIAGTRKRGANEKEDKASWPTICSPIRKERSEHLMLLDLGRNDVGRVSEFGSVKVTIPSSSSVIPTSCISSRTSRASCRKDHDIVDALFAGFPAGTVSGAPKVRAMEIIDELEPTRGLLRRRRGLFSGNGEMDSCIALRTGIVKNGKLYVQAGAVSSPTATRNRISGNGEQGAGRYPGG
jgi:isochorismate synthase EntC